jgi:hypothetical protein
MIAPSYNVKMLLLKKTLMFFKIVQTTAFSKICGFFYGNLYRKSRIFNMCMPCTTDSAHIYFIVVKVSIIISAPRTHCLL